MSIIDSLIISGVRAFGPGVAEKIDFDVPLTLIVGHNGSGKTTIIEALKYATTGMLPPGLQGVAQTAFLHDPKLDSEQGTNALVKVRIIGRNRATKKTSKVVVTRRMEILKKHGKFAFETKNATMALESAGVKGYSHTATKTQLDLQVPHILGVSPAVLDSVIFCHQDESLWPMSGAADLKKRFDKLFEIEKWVKCITEMNELSRNQRSRLEVLKRDVIHAKLDKDRGAQLEKKCQALQDKSAVVRAEVLSTQAQIDVAQANVLRARTGLFEASASLKKLDLAKVEVRVKQERMLQIREDMEELIEDTAALENLLARYDERTNQYKESTGERRGRYTRLQNDIAAARTTLSTAEQALGSATAQQSNHQNQLEIRQQLVKTMATRHDIRGFSGTLDDHQIRAFAERLTRMAKDSHDAVNTAKQSTASEISEVQAQLGIIKERRIMQANLKDNAKQNIQDNDKRIGQLQREHDQIDVDEGTQAIVQTRLEDARARAAAAKNSTSAADYPAKEHSLEIELENVQVTKANLEVELKKATENMNETAQLDVTKKNMADRQQRLDTLHNAHKSRIDEKLGDSWNNSDVKARYEQAIAQAATELQKSVVQRDQHHWQLGQVDDKIKSCDAKLSACEDSVKAARKAIEAVVVAGPEGYHAEIEELEAVRDTTKTDAESFKVFITYLDQCRKDADTKHVCRTCTRPLSEKEVDVLRKSVQREKSKLELAPAQVELAEVEKDLKMAKAVAPQVELWTRLTTQELPSLQHERQRLITERASTLQSLEISEDLTTEKTRAKREIEAIGQVVQSINSLSIELQSYEKDLRELGAKLANIDVARDLKSINDDRESASAQESTIQKALSKLRFERDKAEKTINRLEHEVKDMHNEIMTTESQFKEKVRKSNEIEGLKASTLSHKMKIQECERSLDASKTDLEAAQEKLDDATQRGFALEKELGATALTLDKSLFELSQMQMQLDMYTNSGGPERLERARTNVQDLKDRINALDRETHDVAREIEAIDKELKDHDQTRRNIDKNLNYRTLAAELAVQQQSINDLEGRDTDAQLRQYEQDRKHWENQETVLRIKLEGKSVELGGLDRQLTESLDEWTTTFQHAASNYRKTHIQYEVTTACVKDVSQYANAMEKALLSFHTAKMNAINKALDELWRKTYQGSDIDTIFIEAEDAAGSSSKKKYNYQLFMKKMNTVMEMRGRCSAGQKVLACILVRLALAECFGTECGLIALDEPTTNLDRENIQALALSLAELIKLRRAQKNFQLIIITHDEEFLKYMDPGKYVDHYFRVIRNNRQKSHIEEEQISYLMRH